MLSINIGGVSNPVISEQMERCAQRGGGEEMQNKWKKTPLHSNGRYPRLKKKEYVE